MGKITKTCEVLIAELKPYERNAKIHNEYQLEKLCDSINEFGFLNPCIIDKEKNVIAGHGRILAAEKLGWEKVPCVYVEGLTDEQRRAYILADNKLSELAEWDNNIIFEELEALAFDEFNVDITGFEMPSDSEWFEERERFDMQRQEGNDEYNEFLDKFEQPKTTDDCYTPDNIYEIVAEFVEKEYGKKRKDFVRPFYPGGDYQNEQYRKNNVVVDNPPFSILSEIVDFYIERDQPFFLFAPGLLIMNYATKDLCIINAGTSILYENGATVDTGFLTNMESPDIVVKSSYDLKLKLEVANEENRKLISKTMPKYEYPMEVLTAAKLQWLVKYGQELEIKRNDCVVIRVLDAQKGTGKGIYGSGLLLSERAAAERAAAERAAAERAAAERAAATTWPLSERELEIVKSLGGNDE